MPINPEYSNYKGYLGNKNLKRSGVQINWTPEMVEEYVKCSNDPIYFAEKYMTIVTLDRGKELIQMFPYQKKLVRLAVENSHVIAEMSRQAGKTTAVCALVLWYILFHEDKTVAILANKAETARQILSRIQLAYEHLPKWLQQGVLEWNKGSFQLENNSMVLAAATSSNNIRGYSINMLILDEAAHIDGWDEFFTSVYPTISAGMSTKIVLISSVYGLNHFYKIAKLAKEGKNEYKHISVSWQDVPGRDEKWKDKTLAGMNWDYDKFNQEYENEYLGSSGTLIAGWKLKQLASAAPLSHNDELNQFERPIKKHIYVIVADVSRGKGLDYSAFSVIDVTQPPYKQVCTFKSNMITPFDYAATIHQTATFYNKATVLVEINDIGEQTASLLYDHFEYENLLFTEAAGRAGKRVSPGYGSSSKADPGIRTTKPIKSVGCSLLKLLIEQDKLTITDFNTIDELSRFSKKGQTYQAEDGYHDDLVMGLVLFAWLTDQDYFKELTDISILKEMKDKTEEQMLEDFLPFGYSDGNHLEDTEPIDEFRKPPKHWLLG